MGSLGDELPKECARVRKLVTIYQQIGPAGRYAILLMEAALQRADQATISGDLVEMIRAYEDLKGFHE